jgi:hypothetical protein
LHWLLARLDVSISVLSTFLALVPLISLAYAGLSFHMLRGFIGLSL